MIQTVDACIVGGGPGGALLAYLLAKKGFSVLLLERSGQIAKSFRGEHINEEGEAILKKHNLFDAVEKLGLLKMGQLEYWHNGQLIKTISHDPAVGHLGIHVPQAHLLQAIFDAAQLYEGFEYYLNSRVTDLFQDADGRYTGVHVIRDGEKFIINSKLLSEQTDGFQLFEKRLRSRQRSISTVMTCYGLAYQLPLAGSPLSKWHSSRICRFHYSLRQKTMYKSAGIYCREAIQCFGSSPLFPLSKS